MFFLFLGLSHPILDKNNAGKRIFTFLISFFIFFRIFLPKSSMNGIRELNFFLSFSAYLIPFWLKIMSARGFLIFSIFCYFFRNFLTWDKYELNSGVKFFFHCLRLYHPVSAKNNVGKRFLNFFNFFAIFFGIFLPGSSVNGIRE